MIILYLLEFCCNLENPADRQVSCCNSLFEHSKLRICQVFLNDWEDLCFFSCLSIALCKPMVTESFFEIDFLRFDCSFGSHLSHFVILIFFQVDCLKMDKSFWASIRCQKIVFSTYYPDALRISRSLEQVHFPARFLICSNYSCCRINLVILYCFIASI